MGGDLNAATNGTRPEFVTLSGKTYVATTDYGDIDNHVRLDDPAALLTADRTTDPGVLAYAWPAGAFVQPIRWLPACNAAQQSDRAAQSPDGTIVFAQNMTAGEGYLLTLTVLGTTDDLRDFPPNDMTGAKRELKGFAPLPGPHAPAILLSAHAKSNVIFAPIDLIE
ncbi:MAG: hypothetical protein AAGI54_10675 [Planctomycetota bacterium]